MRLCCLCFFDCVFVLVSGFFLYLFFPSLILLLSSFWTALSSPMSPDLKALFLLEEGLYIQINPWLVVREAQHSLGRCSVLHTEMDVICDAGGEAVLPMTLAEFFPHSWLETVPHSLIRLVGPPLHCAPEVCTEAGDEPGCDQISQKGEGVLSYMPPWCWHRKGPVFNCQICVKVGRVEDGEAWLKSPEMRKRACGCCVCSLITTECRTSQAVSALAEGGTYAAIAMREFPG